MSTIDRSDRRRRLSKCHHASALQPTSKNRNSIANMANSCHLVWHWEQEKKCRIQTMANRPGNPDSAAGRGSGAKRRLPRRARQRARHRFSCKARIRINHCSRSRFTQRARRWTSRRPSTSRLMPSPRRPSRRRPVRPRQPSPHRQSLPRQNLHWPNLQRPNPHQPNLQPPNLHWQNLHWPNQHWQNLHEPLRRPNLHR